jgi:hypothetical protein
MLRLWDEVGTLIALGNISNNQLMANRKPPEINQVA